MKAVKFVGPKKLIFTGALLASAPTLRKTITPARTLLGLATFGGSEVGRVVESGLGEAEKSGGIPDLLKGGILGLAALGSVFAITKFIKSRRDRTKRRERTAPTIATALSPAVVAGIPSAIESGKPALGAQKPVIKEPTIEEMKAKEAKKERPINIKQIVKVSQKINKPGVSNETKVFYNDSKTSTKSKRRKSKKG